MDPLLEQKARELFRKLQTARARNIEITPDHIEDWMRRETQGKYGAADAQQFMATLGDVSLKNVGTALGQGATFGFGDELAGKIGDESDRDAIRMRDAAFRAKHPWLSTGLKVVGALGAPAAVAAAAPEAAVGGTAAGGALLTRAALGGAAAAGLQGAGDSEAETIGGRLKDAAPAAATGLVLGPTLALGAKGAVATAKGLRNLLTNPDVLAIERAGRLMPPSLEMQAARHEMLAPGTFLPAAASPEATAAATGVGASPRAGLESLEQARTALTKIRAAKREVATAYDELGRQAGPLKVDNDLRDLLHNVGEDQMGKSVGFDALQKLRTKYREKGAASSKSGDRHKFGQFVEGVTEWLNSRVPGLAEVDSRYSFLSRSEENAEKLFQTVSNSNMAHGRTALYGGEAGSIGGHLPAMPRGLAIAARIAKLLEPDRAKIAESASRMFVTPADQSRVAALAAARTAATQPPAPTPYSNFTAPVGGSSAVMSLFHMLSGAGEMPEQLQAPTAP